jgi:hypothetical protein
MHRHAALSIVLIAAAIVGCESPSPTTQSYSLLRLQDVSRSAAFDAAVLAMGERFRLSENDRDQGLLRSEPQEADVAEGDVSVGGVVGVPRRVRKVATTMVSGSERSAEVWCKVVVERYDTTARSALSQELSSNDLPTATAAERDAPTTAQQNEVWRATGRDRKTERAVLAAIEELTGRRPEVAAEN